MNPSTPADAPDSLIDTALRQHLQSGDDPPDAGFSLRVMSALPPQVSPAQRRRARWVRRTHWMAMTLAGGGAASLLAAGGVPIDLPRLVGGLALIGLLIFWAVPAPWNRP